eukprot:1359845-Amorphochlora_amoeboformis.AAC.1
MGEMGSWGRYVRAVGRMPGDVYDVCEHRRIDDLDLTIFLGVCIEARRQVQGVIFSVDTTLINSVEGR